jgi:anti-sigma factor RsiW
MSTDRHTVKPWFLGKLDFSPDVPDLSVQGFELIGGRLDYLANSPVASLIYRRRQHIINLFTWPATHDKPIAAASQNRQGFHVRGWQESGMNYWAVSDLNDKELDEFVTLVQGAALEARS